MTNSLTPPRRCYRGILLDLDGVLADTREWVVTAYVHTARAHGFEPSEESLVGLFGQPLEHCYRELAAHLDSDLLTGTHRAYQRENMDLVRPFSGVREMLTSFTNAGLRLAIITGRTHASALETLALLDLTHFFPIVMGCDDTARHKPDPEPIHVVLTRWNMAPTDALMVGDAISDILCGQRAGCDTAGALYGFVGDGLRDTMPTYVLDKPEDLREIVLGG